MSKPAKKTTPPRFVLPYEDLKQRDRWRRTAKKSGQHMTTWARALFDAAATAAGVTMLLLALTGTAVAGTAVADGGGAGAIRDVCGYDYTAARMNDDVQGCSVELLSHCYGWGACKAACGGASYIVTDKGCTITRSVSKPKKYTAVPLPIGGALSLSAGSGGSYSTGASAGGMATLVGGAGGAADVVAGTGIALPPGRGGNGDISGGHGEPDGEVHMHGVVKVNGSLVVTRADLDEASRSFVSEARLDSALHATAKEMILYGLLCSLLGAFLTGLVLPLCAALAVRLRARRIRVWRARQPKPDEGPFRTPGGGQ